MSRQRVLYGAVCVCLILMMAATTAHAQTYAFVNKWGSGGTGDGQFDYAEGVGIDTAGNVYVGDPYNNRVQKFTSDGTFITKWGTPGTGDGQLSFPWGIGVDGSDNVYVVDSSNNRIQKFTSDGTFVTKWGSLGTGDGQFNQPTGVAISNSGEVYVSDGVNCRIQKFTSDGTFVTKWGSSGTGDGQFNYPSGVAVDGSGNVYVSGANNHNVQQFTSAGTFITKWGTAGTADGQFNTPYGVAIDSAGDVYVTDRDNNRIQKFTSDGTFITKWGSYGSGDGQLDWAHGVAVDPRGFVYIPDTVNNRMQVFAGVTAVIDSITPAPALAGQSVTFTGHGVDATHAITAHEWQSDRDGQIGTAASFSTTSLSLNSHVISYRVQCAGGFWSLWTPWSGNPLVIQNNPPTITGVALTPDPAYTTDDLLATPSGWSDPENDPENYSWQWEKDTGGGFAVIGGETTNTLVAANFAKGDVVRVTCTPNDGIDAGTPVTDDITIGNTAPTAPTVTILPAPPTADVSLRATTSGSADADGDPISYSYQWYKNGALQPGRIYRSLAAQWTLPGQTWRVVVTPNDGFDDGATGEDTVTINTPPTAPTVAITPADPVNSDSLRADVSGSVDSNGDPITYTYKWFKDGIEQAGVTWRTIGAWRTLPGQVWRVVVTPDDGLADGSTGEATVTINTRPGPPVVVINPSNPDTTDNLPTQILFCDDPDGDAITYTYQWYKDGVLQPGVIWRSIGAWRTRAGQTWKCVVTPSDLHGAGQPGEATVVIAAKGGPLTVSGLAALPTARGAEVAFTLSADAAVTCEVLNIAGRAVKTIVADRPMAEGINSLAWDGSNAAGLRAPAGVYLVRMTATTESGSLSTSMSTLSLTR